MIVRRRDLPFAVSDKEWSRWLEWFDRTHRTVEVRQVYVAVGTSLENAKAFLDWTIARGAARERFYIYCRCEECPVDIVDTLPTDTFTCPECGVDADGEPEPRPLSEFAYERFGKCLESFEVQ